MNLYIVKRPEAQKFIAKGFSPVGKFKNRVFQYVEFELTKDIIKHALGILK